jgi:hypothetical protein
MATFGDAAGQAERAQEAMRALAHVVRTVDDPGAGYAVLGELKLTLVSLEFTLRTLGAFYATHAHEQASVGGDHAAGQAAARQVADELQRASSLASTMYKLVDHAHNVEATIAYPLADTEP